MGLQALNLATPVYYSLVSFALGLVSAAADVPLPVGDIVAGGGGIVTGTLRNIWKQAGWI
ncbi:hypothetical protein [Clostridium tagluense]|nr:hypothetical protein [Clostridium tagluense]MBU3130493.1 hypothetical protein [Clostridium tagluense]MCB2336749.1 hypothetical protein [Clostridium tagluense]